MFEMHWIDANIGVGRNQGFQEVKWFQGAPEGIIPGDQKWWSFILPSRNWENNLFAKNLIDQISKSREGSGPTAWNTPYAWSSPGVHGCEQRGKGTKILQLIAFFREVHCLKYFSLSRHPFTKTTSVEKCALSGWGCSLNQTRICCVNWTVATFNPCVSLRLTCIVKWNQRPLAVWVATLRIERNLADSM